ncbi:Nucleotidyltransferase [Auriscalpium vulgare]|uniref:Nucleotidyltransferase n=1 Tax=Auriscalpium vulgare TaxID=40419 RepID=A0ACB8R6T7_9AGAM|nr:Nucleotidyltransferase [Auriscalpium vulgare]
MRVLSTTSVADEESSPARNGYKVRSFQIAISALRQEKQKIASGQEAMKLRGIGVGIAERIDMHLAGKEYDTSIEASARRRAQLVSELRTVPGLGERTAAELVQAGVKSITDLVKPEFEKFLSAAQKVGVTYAAHMERPISRTDAEAVATFIRDHVSSKFEVIVTGGYRLGASEFSEIEILILHPNYVHVPMPQTVPKKQSTKVVKADRQESPILRDVVPALMSSALLAATLSQGPRKWQGVCLLPTRQSDGSWYEVGDRLRDLRATRGKYMRLDLNLAPMKSRGAALLALTGDRDFYRNARLSAERIGMHLNEFGLWRFNSADDAPSDGAAEANGFWELIAGETEESILAELDIGWVEPARRNFRFINNKSTTKTRKRSAYLGLNLAALPGDTAAPTSPSTGKRGRPRKTEVLEGEKG